MRHSIYNKEAIKQMLIKEVFVYRCYTYGRTQSNTSSIIHSQVLHMLRP